MRRQSRHPLLQSCDPTLRQERLFEAKTAAHGHGPNGLLSQHLALSSADTPQSDPVSLYESIGE